MQASMCSTQPPANSKDFYTPTRTNRTLTTERESTGSPVSAVRVYIGETKRNLPTRLKEHRAHGRRGDFEKSAIVKHSHIKDHQIDWQAAQLITPIDARHPRRIREAIEIVKHDTVPQDIGFYHQRHLATNTTDWRIFYIQSP